MRPGHSPASGSARFPHPSPSRPPRLQICPEQIWERSAPPSSHAPGQRQASSGSARPSAHPAPRPSRAAAGRHWLPALSPSLSRSSGPGGLRPAPARPLVSGLFPPGRLAAAGKSPGPRRRTCRRSGAVWEARKTPRTGARPGNARPGPAAHGTSSDPTPRAGAGGQKVLSLGTPALPPGPPIRGLPGRDRGPAGSWGLPRS